MFNGAELTTPEKIDRDVRSFCRKISTKELVFIDVSPEPWCRQGCCEMNVERFMEERGGNKVLGYKIWSVKRKYVEAERHAVLEIDGVLIDPTFNSDGEGRILFLPDDKEKAFDDRRLKLRQGLTQKTRLWAESLKQQDAGVVRMSEEESWNRMLTYERWLAGERMPNMWQE